MEIDVSILVELESNVLLQEKTFFEFCNVYMCMHFINVCLYRKACLKFH